MTTATNTGVVVLSLLAVAVVTAAVYVYTLRGQ